METIYKIRRGDGLFSTGGMYPQFTKKGKIWRNRGHVTSHLNQLGNTSAYKDSVVVTFEVVETEVDTTTVSEYIEGIAVRKEAERERQRQAVAARLLEQERKTYEALRKKFEGTDK